MSRKTCEENLAAKLSEFLEKLSRILEVAEPFDVELDDAAGVSQIENPFAPSSDSSLHISHYKRNTRQQIDLGIVGESSTHPDLDDSKNDADTETGNDLHEEVLMFPGRCSSCSKPCQTNMKLVNVPHFKEVIIMCTICESCGFKDTETKSGSGVEPKGIRLDLHLRNRRDLSRDVLKSDTCTIEIPELDFHMEGGSISSKFTTVEGLLNDIKHEVLQQTPFIAGDTAQKNVRKKLTEFSEKLTKMESQGSGLNIHVILDDPAGNSYIQNLLAPALDPQLKVIEYERTEDQNEQLGLKNLLLKDENS